MSTSAGFALPVAQLPDPHEHRRRWGALELADRRRISKAVNRGRALTDRREAALAVNVARSQQRFWSRAWLLAPAVSLLFFGQGWQAVAVNAVFATLVLGGMSLLWYRRAARAEQANLEVVGVTAGTSRPHRSADAPPPASEDQRAGTPHTANPPKRSRARRRSH